MFLSPFLESSFCPIKTLMALKHMSLQRGRALERKYELDLSVSVCAGMYSTVCLMLSVEVSHEEDYFEAG